MKKLNNCILASLLASLCIGCTTITSKSTKQFTHNFIVRDEQNNPISDVEIKSHSIHATINDKEKPSCLTNNEGKCEITLTSKFGEYGIPAYTVIIATASKFGFANQSIYDKRGEREKDNEPNGTKIILKTIKSTPTPKFQSNTEQVAYYKRDSKIIKFEEVLPLAKKQSNKSIKAYETTTDYIESVKINCEKQEEKKLCQPIYIQNKEKYSDFDYDAETALLKIYSFLGSKSFHFSSTRKHSSDITPCGLFNSESIKETNYIGQTAFNVKAKIHHSESKYIGVAYHATNHNCTDKVGHQHLSRLNKNTIYLNALHSLIEISKEDFKNEGGTFITELVGIPQAPYHVNLQRNSAATLDNPYSQKDTSESVLITPIYAVIYGGKTKKIYLEYKF